MNPFLELQLLLVSNPELAALQFKYERDTEYMTALEKCEYLQKLMVENCLELGVQLQVLLEVL